MTSDYREALELISDPIPRLPRLTEEQTKQLLSCIPDDEWVSRKQIAETAVQRKTGITKDQINRRLRKFIADNEIEKKFNLHNSRSDMRRVLYRRRGMMG